MTVPRREYRKHDPLIQVLDRVRLRLSSSPLACIGQQVEAVLALLRHGFIANDTTGRLANHIAGMLDLLPQSFGERFYFDAGMITALAEEWSEGKASLSGMIVPTPGQEWGHMSLPLMAYTGEPVHVIDLVLMPGDEQLADI